MKFKKLSKGLMALGTSASLLSMVALSASCEKSHPKKPQNMIADVKINPELKLTADQLKNAPKIAMITDGGSLFDKSFNQSSWEGVIRMAEQSNYPISKYNAFETNGDYSQQYQNALNDGAKILVLSGYNHKEKITEFYKTHKSLFLDEKGKPKVTIVSVDFALDTDDFAPGLNIALQFNTKQGGFLAGYAAATYMKDQAEELRTFATFGGGSFPGVTDFMEGFFKGALYFDKEQTDNTKKYFSKNGEEVYIHSDFNIADQSKQSEVTKKVFANNPALVLPVAGPWTGWVANSSYFKKPNKFVVGVDVDQYYSDTKNGDKYFTSILKNIAQSVYDALGALLTGKSDSLGGFVAGEKSAKLYEGIEQNWVGLSPTHLTDRTEDAENAINNALTVYSALPQATKEWINSNKASMDGEEIADIQTRLNELSKLTSKDVQTAPVSVSDNSGENN